MNRLAFGFLIIFLGGFMVEGSVELSTAQALSGETYRYDYKKSLLRWHAYKRERSLRKNNPQYQTTDQFYSQYSDPLNSSPRSFSIQTKNRSVSLSPRWQSSVRLSELNEEPIKIMDLAILPPTGVIANRSTFQEAIIVDKVYLDASQSTGLATQFENFKLQVGSKTVSFSSEGLAVVDLGSVRVNKTPATVEVFLQPQQVEDLVGWTNGLFSLRVLNGRAYEEISRNPVTVHLPDQGIGQTIRWQLATPDENVGQVISSAVDQIESKAVLPNETFPMLKLKFLAEMEPVRIKKITIADADQNQDLRYWIREVQVFSAENLSVPLSRGYWINDQLSLSFSPWIEIARDEKKELLLTAQVRESSLQSDEWNTVLQPVLSQVEAFSGISGRAMTEERLSIDQSDFPIFWGLQTVPKWSWEPMENSVVGTEDWEDVAIFRLENPSERHDFLIRQLGLRIQPGGALSALNESDLGTNYRLLYRKKGAKFWTTGFFSTSHQTGDYFTFYSSKDLEIRDGSWAEFLVQGKFSAENSGGDPTVRVQWAKDQGPQTGTANSLRNAEVFNIWSDDSDSSHQSSSDDYHSGYYWQGTARESFWQR